MPLDPNFLLRIVEELVQYVSRDGKVFGVAPLLHVQDEKTQNTAGGTFTSGSWQKRDLNTEKTNEIVGASLASSQVTLPAGTYWAEFSAPALRIDSHQARLQDTTNTVTLIVGTSENAENAAGTGNDTSRSVGVGRFTLSSEAVIELQHQCETTLAGVGLGLSCNFTTEVYSILKIWRVGR